MDYQASTSSNEGKISFSTVIKKAALLAAFFIVFISPHNIIIAGATTTPNPLTIDITVSATVLVTPGTRPDTPPANPPGPVSTVDTIDVAIFKGKSYPESTVLLLKNSLVIASVKANADGAFDIRLRGINPGTYTFGIQAQDGNRLQSRLLVFTIFLSGGVATTVSGIFVPPTITSDKVDVKKGEDVTFFGSSVANAEVRLSFSSSVELLKKTSANASGSWAYTLDSSELPFGDFEAKARSITATDLSLYSDPLLFKVGSITKNRIKGAVLTGFRKKCDLNDDNRVNLLDFSIMAFWYKRLGFPVKVDLNTDNNVNLTDLSILAFCWTG